MNKNFFIHYILGFILIILLTINFTYSLTTLSNKTSLLKSAEPKPALINNQVKEISIGGEHSAVIYTDTKGNDHLYTFGSNANGELGNGTTDNSTPTEILLPFEIQFVSSGSKHTGVVVSDDNNQQSLFMWGNNEYSQLGIEGGRSEDILIPTEVIIPGVEDGDTITGLSLGYYHSGIITNDNDGNDHLYMWGKDSSGQIGLNEPNKHDIPNPYWNFLWWW